MKAADAPDVPPSKAFRNALCKIIGKSTEIVIFYTILSYLRAKHKRKAIPSTRYWVDSKQIPSIKN